MTARDSVDKPGPSFTSLPDRPCPFRRPATLGLSGNSPPPEGWPQAGVVPLGRQVALGSRFTIHIHIPPRASAGGRQVVGRLPSVHDSRFTLTSPHGRRQVVGRWSAGCLRVHDSRFTFTSPHERRQVVGRWSAGCLRVHDSRFTFTSPHRRRQLVEQVVGKSALADSPTRRALSRRGSSVSLRRERGVRQLGVGILGRWCGGLPGVVDAKDGWTGRTGWRAATPSSGLRPPSPPGEGPIM